MLGVLHVPETLRERALRADQEATTGVRLADLWSELMAGEASISDWFFSRERCLLVVDHARLHRPKLDERRRETLEWLLLGVGQKRVALELGVGVSTVATLCRQALDYLNIHVSYAKVPVALVVLARAYRESRSEQLARRAFIPDGEGASVISFPRPDLVLSWMLSPAECAVGQLCVEGHSHAEIASLRVTSLRTVANQLASVFQKLRVSGRAELLARITGRAPRDAQGAEVDRLARWPAHTPRRLHARRAAEPSFHTQPTA